MSRSSTVTARRHPAVDRQKSSGPFAVQSETLTIRTSERVELLDLTDRVTALVRGMDIRDGILNLFSLHTTCTLFINEFQSALVADIKRLLDELISRDDAWMHNDPEHSDCDRMNADAHLRAMLFGHSVTLQVSGGEVVLGQWQRILLAELDGPRDRTLRLTAMGVQ